MTDDNYNDLDLETAIDIIEEQKEIIKQQKEEIKELTRELKIADRIDSAREARYESIQKWRYYDSYK